MSDFGRVRCVFFSSPEFEGLTAELTVDDDATGGRPLHRSLAIRTPEPLNWGSPALSVGESDHRLN